MGKIRIAVAGVGNCCSSLIQGINYYSKNGGGPGLLNETLGKYHISDIEFVAAFDIDKKKIGVDLSEAIFSEPNKAPKLIDVPNLEVLVQMGPSPDIIIDNTMSMINKSSTEPVDIASTLKKSKADILLNLISGGSDKASRLYAEACIDAGCGFLNATPTSIVNDLSILSNFKKNGLPVIGDDLLSQIGATAIHIGLLEFLHSRGVNVEESYQLDVGGGSESINTLEKTRNTKREIKTNIVKKSIPYEFKLVSGSADFVDFLINGRDSYFWLKGKYFGGATFTMDVKLSTMDSPNAGAVLVDSIRGLKIALDRGIGGAIEPICAYGFKRPPKTYPIAESYKRFIQFVEA